MSCEKCGLKSKFCECEDRSRSRERREKEAKEEKEKDKESVKDLTDLLQRLDGRAELREKKTKEEMLKLIQDNDDKWKKRLEEDRKELMRIQDEKTDSKLRQSEQKTMAEFEKLRKEIKEGKKESAAVKISEDDTTLLFGGLQDMSFEDAEKWVRNQIEEKKLQEPSIVYHKGEAFSGIVFAKFSNDKTAQDIAKTLTMVFKSKGERIWCKKDLPLEQRVPLSFLLGLRRQLITWGFTKRKPRVEEESNTLTVGGNPVVKVTVDDNRLALQWMSQEWKDWKELVESSEFKNLKEKAEEKLAKAEDKGKGDGKGKTRH